MAWLFKKGNGGSGNGIKFAKTLRDNIGFISNPEGISKSVHIERLNLIDEGVGKDKISDMVTNISLKFLLEFTQTFAENNIDPKYLKNFKVDNVYFDYDYGVFKPDHYTLPFITNAKGKNEYVLLTPSEILRADEPAINLKRFKHSYEDVIPMIENKGLRALISRHIADSINRAKNAAPPKKKLSETQIVKISRNAFFEVVEKHPVLYDYFIRYMETDSKNITLVSEVERTRVRKRFIDNINDFVEDFEYILPLSVVENSVEEARLRLEFFKDCIENKDGYRMFNDKNGRFSNEDDFQRAFTLVWFNAVSKVSAESNNGRGPVDFNISIGQKNQVNIEFKLASNPKMVKVLTQLEAYDAAHGAKCSIVVIAYFDDKEKIKVDKFFEENKSILTKGENFFTLDCRIKVSASKI